ncbi:MAG: ThiF family adenylyltransferase [Anaerolineae bacterium]|nr:ThiF family adenylyltransferase [Anaerolineae bacterium]
MMQPYWLYLKQLALYVGQQGRTLLKRLYRRLLPPLLPRPLSPHKTYRLDIGHPDRVVILLIGCGGTGAFVAHILAQLANWARSAGIDLRLYFVDHDIIEEKNLVRQNFCAAEVGYPKAFSLAWRYTAAFGLTITPVVEQFSAELLDRFQPAYSPQGTLTIVIGAVDNVCARRKMAEAITAKLKQQHGSQHKFFWLDAGNERLSGQVLIGNSLEPEPLLSPLGYCLGLPLPHLQEPSLLLERDHLQQELSCADLNLRGEQSAMINRMMATLVGVYLYRLLQSRDLGWSGSWVNLQTGMTKSIPITGGRLVLPERPQHIPVRAAAPEEMAETCPDCGGEIIAGQDEYRGVLIAVRFCAACPWREEVCPECGGELGEDVVDFEGNGRPVPVLNCLQCEWYALIPENEAVTDGTA